MTLRPPYATVRPDRCGSLRIHETPADPESTALEILVTFDLISSGRSPKQYLSVTLDTPIENIEVAVIVKAIGGIAIADALKTIHDDRERAAQLEQEATVTATKLAKDLVAQNVPLRDIGSILGVTFQRAHQLATA